MRLYGKWARAAGCWGLAVCLAATGCGDTENGAEGGSAEEGGSGEGTNPDGAGSEGDAHEEGGPDGEGAEGDGSEGEGAEGDGSEGDGSEGGPEPGEPIVQLISDHNRNGRIDLDDPTEVDGADTWDETGGAIFLANLDDDEERCSPFAGTDYDLAACFDGADEVVNGEADLLDMAPLHVRAWPTAPEDAIGRLAWTPGKAAKVRLFKKTEGEPSEYPVWTPGADVLTAAELRAGVDFYLEGTGIVTNRAEWDGYVDLTLQIERGSEVLGSSKVRLRVAPLQIFHHLQPGHRVYAAQIQGSQSSMWFRDGIREALEIAEQPEEAFWEYLTSDQWTQDYFEPGHMIMPGPDGGTHVMEVHIRSANLQGQPPNPLRPAGRVVFQWRGPDVAALQLFDINHHPWMDTLDSFGNTETIPPYSLNGEDYPLGRIYRGSVPSFFPDPKQTKMFEDQLMQPPVYTDTSWLLVAHVDETISFLEADNERGWAIISNDPILAKTMFEEQVALGNGDETMFKGKKWAGFAGGASAETSINEALDDTNVMAESLKTAAAMLEQEQVLKDATGITDDEIFHIAYLHESVQGHSLAWQVGTINGLVYNNEHFLCPKPHGPEIDGVDIMEQQFEDIVHGILGHQVHFIENWDLYHVLSGELHCGSNTMREPTTVNWWETGR